ncbi:MAG: oligosaccharide flippase family protein [Candidatus Azambacteria bacterium]|nr:oligosaccharide flippase family protein [Candidatus Azambacteria bacterium]
MAQKSLKKHFISLSKDSLVYGLGNAITAVTFFLAAPILTRKFSPADYGVIALIASSIAFLNLFLIFGMDTATTLTYYQEKKDQKGIVSGVLLFLTLWGLILIGAAVIYSEEISELLFRTNTYRLPLIAALITAFLNLLINFAKTVFRLEFKAKLFALVTAFNAIFSMGLAILLIYLEKGILGYFLGGLVGVFLSFIFALWLIREKFTLKIAWPRLKETIWHGAAIVPVSLAYFVFNLSNRFFISRFRSLEELGLFAIAVNINSILTFFSVALGRAWVPYVLKMHQDSKRTFNQFMPRIFTYFLIFFFCIATLISIFRYEILALFTTSKYFAAGEIIGILSFAIVCSATTQVTSIGMYVAKKTKKLAFWAIISAILNIILNLLLIPRFGMAGAAWATAATYLFLTLAYFFESQRLIKLKYAWVKLINLTIISLLFIFFSPIFWRYGFYENLVIKVFEFALFFMLLYLLKVIEKNELKYLKSFTAKITSRFRNRGGNDH